MRTLNHNVTAFIHRFYCLASISLNIIDKHADFLSRRMRFFSQLTDFLSYHCKTTSLLTSTSRLNSRIQGQEVGLTCQIRNRIYNSTNFLRTLAQLIHQDCSRLNGGLYATNLIYSYLDSLAAINSLVSRYAGIVSCLTGSSTDSRYTVCNMNYRFTALIHSPLLFNHYFIGTGNRCCNSISCLS